jgi:prepilin-type N-terminal cleavage/methylation domain-containing protein
MKNGLRRHGFTLIEVLVVVSVTLVLSGILLVGFGGKARSQNAVFVDAAKISEVILRAKALAISTYNIPPIPCGYGFQMHGIGGPMGQKYSLIYYDVPANDIRCTDIENMPLATSSVRVLADNSGAPQTFSMSPGSNLAPGVDMLFYVLFVPPNPDTHIYFIAGNPVTNRPLSLYLMPTGGTFADIYTISVSPNGQLTYK